MPSLALAIAWLPAPALLALTNNLALTPPMGWNDWNTYGCGINQAVVETTADTMATNGMLAAGYQYVDIDDCWQISRDSTGVIVADPAKFPGGIQSVAAYVHADGLKLGVYTDHGTNTCQHKPGSYGFEYIDAITYGSWGVDYLKDDNCNLPANSVAQADYGRMSDGLMKSGRPILFCLCGGATAAKGYQSWSPALGNYWRTTGDISDSYSSMISHLDPNSTSAYAAGPGRWNDPDMLEVGRGGMSSVEDQTHFTMWCIMAAPLIAGNNITAMSAQALATLTNPEAIAVDQDSAGEQGVKVVNNSSPVGTNEVWSKTLGCDFSTRAVVLFNRLGPATNITCYWTNLGLQAGSATVRDLWAHSNLGSYTNSFTANVASHAAMLLQVVGTPPLLPGLGTTYLSDLQAAYAYTGWGTILKDKSIGGNTLTLNGVTYSKGIGVNSRAGSDYDLGGICSRFQATVGVDDEVGSAKGSVHFEVFADGLKIYDSAVMVSGALAQTVDLDVTGVSRLILGVGDADDGNSYDHGDWANARVIVTNLTPRPPYPPTGLMASSGNAITLTWNNSLAAAGYNIKRSSQSGGPYTTIGSTAATVFSDASVIPGSTYFYTLTATNIFGEGTNCPEVTATACAPPDPPTVSIGSVSPSQVVLSWTTSPGATTYSLNRFTTNTPPVVLATGLTATNYVDTNVTPGAIYYYTVTGVNPCNAGVPSLFAAAAVPSIALPIQVWTGGSSSSANWSDAANWGGTNILPGESLSFDGNNRLTNTNNTSAATSYANLVFNIGAGAFSLNGNPVVLNGNITNNSPNSQSLNLGLSFSNSAIFNGAGGNLIIGGSLTDTFGTPGSTTLTLAGSGILTNLLGSTTSPGGTNVLLLNGAGASWTLMDNPSSIGTTAPWVISINNGALNFGTSSSAPTLTTTTVNNKPQDNQVGAVAGTASTLTIFNGTLTTGARLNTATALNCTGIVNQVGGTLNVGSQFQGANGANAGEISLLAVSGGTMNIGSAANPTSPLYVASRGNGTLTLSGGSIHCGTLDVSRNANGNAIGSVGTVNLNGGTLWASRVGTATANFQTNQNGVSATFNFNGGILKATASSPTFFVGNTALPAIPIQTVVKSGGAIIDDGGNTITIAEPLQHDASLGALPDGGLTKLNTGRLTLTANCTCTGPTTVSAGTLALSGSGAIANSAPISLGANAALDLSALAIPTLTLTSGQALSGFGAITGSVVAAGTSIIAPGSSTGLGSLTVSGNVTLNGTTSMKLNKSLHTNDALFVGGTLSYNGTLVLTNLGGSFSGGDNFTLFSAANYSGTFSSIVPSIPAVNLAWNTNSLATGVLGIVSSPTTPPRFSGIALSGTNLVFNGSNGVPNWTYFVLASTNLALPLSQWTACATNHFDTSGNFNFTTPAGANGTQAFFVLKLQ